MDRLGVTAHNMRVLLKRGYISDKMALEVQSLTGGDLKAIDLIKPSKARLIRKAKFCPDDSQSEIGRRFGVSRQAVSRWFTVGPVPGMIKIAIIERDETSCKERVTTNQASQ